ncbi:DUF1203 domain-containing protein [Streptosporangium lutulentum]|uniref:DUF1203 domain-containing protein n=1 Tax=Streptosporangium lutulentum TaxID=1461250 RepID=A0ABT9QNA8_9ACTN|nr:DUF1203 domain-containing protein [Streptosporangium lutulentum]MDP9847404.1 hypothetical protein [Streptosporangium lutulentum]
MSIFRTFAIDAEVVAELRVRDDAGRPPRLIVDAEGGSPLRCCLRRSLPGERLALLSYAPLRRWAARTGGDPGPYEELGPVFVHAEPCEGPGGTGFPVDVGGERRVFRAYDAAGDILGGQLVDHHVSCDAIAAETILAEQFADPEVALVHVRAVEFGCFLFEAHRA